MAAPKGNQYALGGNGGRPREVSLSKEEMIDLGQEMVKWVEENQPLHLSEWYTIKKGFIYKQWKTFIQREEFIPYYEKAIRIVAKKYIDGTVNASIAQRFLRIYFPNLKEQEDEDLVTKHQCEYEFKKNLLELELKLKANSENLIPQEIKDKYNALIEQMNALQSERKIQDSNINADAKS